MTDLVANVFESDAFSFVSLTDSINNQPFVPGRIGEMGLFRETGIATLGVMIENKNGYLSLIAPTPRGGPGESRPKTPRNARTLNTSHFQIDDFINADEVMGVREFGQPASPRTIETYLAQRFGDVTPNFDATLEHQRLGAIKGVILDAAGNTVYNLFNEFGISQPPDVSFALGTSAKPRAACLDLEVDIAKSLGGIPYTGLGAICGDGFWKSLTTHPDVEKTYVYTEGGKLREGLAFKQLPFGNILWEHYKGFIPANDGTGNVTPFVASNEAWVYPLGVPNFFRTVFAPADYMETVNTIGLPRYAKGIPTDNNKGLRLEMQTNPLSYCTRPGALRHLIAA